MRIGVFPGSFDPLTSGHYDLIERAAALVDCLYVAVLKNSDKTPLFTLKQRKEMIESTTALLPNVKVEAFEGLLVDFARQKGASVLFRGLRNQLDYEQETWRRRYRQYAFFQSRNGLFCPAASSRRCCGMGRILEGWYRHRFMIKYVLNCISN